jgi:hypothetical protein
MLTVLTTTGASRAACSMVSNPKGGLCASVIMAEDYVIATEELFRLDADGPHHNRRIKGSMLNGE